MSRSDSASDRFPAICRRLTRKFAVPSVIAAAAAAVVGWSAVAVPTVQERQTSERGAELTLAKWLRLVQGCLILARIDLREDIALIHYLPFANRKGEKCTADGGVTWPMTNPLLTAAETNPATIEAANPVMAEYPRPR